MSTQHIEIKVEHQDMMILNISDPHENQANNQMVITS